MFGMAFSLGSICSLQGDVMIDNAAGQEQEEMTDTHNSAAQAEAAR